MFGIGRSALCFAAALVLACASAASADTVTFNVASGVFGNGSSTASYTTSGTDLYVLPYSVTATISFTAGSPLSYNMIDGQTQAIISPSFGSFHVDVASSGVFGSFHDVAISDTFTLAINVTSPTVASGSTTGLLSGTLEKNSSSDDLTIKLNSLTLPSSGLPSLTFAFNSLTLSDTYSEDTRSLTGSVTYHAAGSGSPTDVRAVPFPSAASVGGSFLLLLGAVAGLRKKLSPRASV